jgi:hypothetical protein
VEWYAAHVIVYTKFLDEVQDKYPVWEKIILIASNSSDLAYQEAERIARNEYDTTGTFTWEGRPARWVFAGVRKLIECQQTVIVAGNDDDIFQPGHGTEITYSQMEVDSEESLSKLIEGEPVTVLYEE